MSKLILLRERNSLNIVIAESGSYLWIGDLSWNCCIASDFIDKEVAIFHSDCAVLSLLL